MKFLHEYSHYPNGQVIENGYWAIEGDRLVNSCGGWHPYTPSPDDEIIDSDWDTIEKLYAKSKINNDATTGWIAPDGTFYGCDYRSHGWIARYLDMTEREMEIHGYVKIFDVFPNSYDGVKYGYWCEKHLTEAQKKVLEQKGIVIFE